ncbi:MAG: glgP [Chlamydiales bacterium]|jgi:starch phosphorylase|nr:glgP [Chlamydiales bacterium]
MEFNIEQKAEILIQKIRHYLMTERGHKIEEASDEDLYQAVSYALREEIMIHWAATMDTVAKNKARTIYYLSLEYLTGRFLSNNISNLQAIDLMQLVVKKMGRDLRKILWVEPDPGLGNGGLGRLAACFMDSLATLQYPAMGYGLRYQYGIFEQQLCQGAQMERPDCWLLRAQPWEFRRDNRAVPVKFCGRTALKTNKAGEQVYELEDAEEVRALPFDIPIIGYSKHHPFSVNTLRLWSTKESPRNFQLQRYNAGEISSASENTMLTDVLYPNDNHETGKRIRLKQEFLLVSASIEDILRRHLANYGNLKDVADKVRIQINDTHPALAVAEMMQQLTKCHNFTWNQAWEVTQQCLSYTNHTVLVEALEQWNQGLVYYLLPRQYHIIERLNMEFCGKIRSHFPNDEERVRRMSILENGQVRMANLSVYGSHHVNGVAALHTDIIKKSVFKDFYEMYPERFINVTNGVTQRRWLLSANPRLADFITKRIGDKWITDFSQIRNLAKFADDATAQKEFLEIKKQNKLDLIDMLNEARVCRDKKCNPTADYMFPQIDPNSLFDVQVKRIHEYKRQLMNAIHVLMVYQDLLENPDSRKIKRTVFIGGKAAPGYQMAKNILRLIYCIGRKINNDPKIKDKLKLIFIENYNVSKAEVIIPAAELSEQISTAGLEASGTGNMKFSMNGALTIGTDDGANVEMREEVTNQWWPFLFGASAERIETLKRSHTYNPWDVYNKHLQVKKAIDMLKDNSLTQNDEEREALNQIYNALMNGINGQRADRYFVLEDLPEYYEMHKKVEALYQDQAVWAKYALHNIAGMAKFSTDNSITTYAKKIWNIQPCPIDKELLKEINFDYTAAYHAICNIPKRGS